MTLCSWGCASGAWGLECGVRWRGAIRPVVRGVGWRGRVAVAGDRGYRIARGRATGDGASINVFRQRHSFLHDV